MESSVQYSRYPFNEIVSDRDLARNITIRFVNTIHNQKLFVKLNSKKKCIILKNPDFRNFLTFNSRLILSSERVNR